MVRTGNPADMASRTFIFIPAQDRELLEQNGIEPDKMFTWVPWFEHYNNLKINPQNKNILFYGAMNRPENYLIVHLPQ